MKGSIFVSSVLPLLSSVRKYAHQVLREPVYRIRSVVVLDHPAFHQPAQPMNIAALQGKIFIGCTELVSAHQAKLIEIREVNRNIGLAPTG